MKETKQVIVIRKDLNMRKGKIAAQASHASMAFLTRGLRVYRQDLTDYPALHNDDYTEERLQVIEEWLKNSYTKICVSVNSEEELLAVYNKAKEVGLISHLVQDCGKTEFNGVPTYTCCAIGPDYKDKIDPITNHLQLL